jgi:hypothetical protein
MLKLNYSNYLKDKNFDFEKEYKKIFVSFFQIIFSIKQKEKSKKVVQTKVREEFKNNKKDIFDDKKNKSLQEIFIKFKEQKIDEFDVIFEDKELNAILTLNQNEIIEILEKNKNKSSLKKLNSPNNTCLSLVGSI